MDSNDTIDQRPDLRLVPDTAACGDDHEQDVDTVAPEQSEHEAQTRVPLDPFDNNQGIEYWLWNGVRLVPAWPDEIARIRARERAYEEQYQAELRRQRAERQQRLLRPVSGLACAIARAWTATGGVSRLRSTLHATDTLGDEQSCPPQNLD